MEAAPPRQGEGVRGAPGEDGERAMREEGTARARRRGLVERPLLTEAGPTQGFGTTSVGMLGHGPYHHSGGGFNRVEHW